MRVYTSRFMILLAETVIDNLFAGIAVNPAIQINLSNSYT